MNEQDYTIGDLVRDKMKSPKQIMNSALGVAHKYRKGLGLAFGATALYAAWNGFTDPMDFSGLSNYN